jgi:hypothetical protein
MEGVDGSSPSEGLPKVPAIDTLLLSIARTRRHIPDTSVTRLVDTLTRESPAKRQLLLPRLARS